MRDDRETIFQFPCRFPIKAMGRAGVDFEALVVESVRRHAPDLGEGSVSVRVSCGGKWVAVTVVVQATGRDQLDAIYRDLSALKQVVWAL